MEFYILIRVSVDEIIIFIILFLFGISIWNILKILKYIAEIKKLVYSDLKPNIAITLFGTTFKIESIVRNFVNNILIWSRYNKTLSGNWEKNQWNEIIMIYKMIEYKIYE